MRINFLCKVLFACLWFIPNFATGFTLEQLLACIESPETRRKIERKIELFVNTMHQLITGDDNMARWDAALSNGREQLLLAPIGDFISGADDALIEINERIKRGKIRDDQVLEALRQNYKNILTRIIEFVFVWEKYNQQGKPDLASKPLKEIAAAMDKVHTANLAKINGFDITDCCDAEKKLAAIAQVIERCGRLMSQLRNPTLDIWGPIKLKKSTLIIAAYATVFVIALSTLYYTKIASHYENCIATNEYAMCIAQTEDFLLNQYNSIDSYTTYSVGKYAKTHCDMLHCKTEFNIDSTIGFCLIFYAIAGMLLGKSCAQSGFCSELEEFNNFACKRFNIYLQVTKERMNILRGLI